MRSWKFNVQLLVTTTLASCMIGEPLDDDAVAGDGIAEEANTAVDDPLSVRVCPASQTVFGIDVSHHQGLIDWTKVKGGGVKYAFIRVSDGVTTRDRQFSRNWTNAKAAGILRGAYQFFRPSQNVATQAQMMIDAIAGSAGDLPPVIDVEVDGGLAPTTVASRVKQWVDKVAAATGRTPIVYTAKYFWRDEVGNSTSFAANPLWVANYTTRCPDIPTAWKAWQFWQTSATGRVPGIAGDVDMNKFNGTQLQLEALTR